MNMYQYFKTMQNNCLVLAKHFKNSGDNKLSTFYAKAAEGFEIKAGNLQLEEIK